jgi:hypothetical protein
MLSEEYALHVILPHPAEPRLLLLPDGPNWTLPSLEMDKPPENGYSVARFGMLLREVAGCAAVALYSPYYARKNDEHGHRLVVVAENRDPAFQLPDGARWLSSDALDAITLTDDYLRPVIADWLRERESGAAPPERPPWAFDGWQDRAYRWIAAQVAARGWTLAGDIELARKWCITCMFKVPTDAGMLYFKAVPDTFAREIEITRFLGALYPDSIPAIVAAEPDEHWLLMRDFDAEILGDSKEIGLWLQALRDYGAMQAGTAAHVDALLARGAMDFRLEVLPDKLDAMLADGEILQPDRHLTAEEIDRLREHAPRIKSKLAELAAYATPPAIIHSDFHPWNVAASQGRTVVFDWTDCGIGHPLCDTAHVFDLIAEEIFTDQPEAAGDIRDAYLSGLSALVPLDVLRRIAPLGELAGFVQQAVNYHHLLRHVEPAERWSLSFMTFLLKKLLTRLEAEALP